MSTPSFAAGSDRVALKALWLEAFGDEPQEIERFFSRFFSEKTALVMRDGCRVVSMLFLLPATVQVGRETRSVGYIYGGATCKQDRGQGHYRRLLSFAQQVAKEQGMSALFLHPADEVLDHSYCRMGFNVPLYAKEIDNPQTLIKQKATELSAREYTRLRNRFLNEFSAAYTVWNVTVFEHCMTWCRAFAFESAAIALIAADWSVVYEYISGNTDEVFLPLQAPREPVRWRCVGTENTVGRLYPLDDLNWEFPVYMGYGME